MGLVYFEIRGIRPSEQSQSRIQILSANMTLEGALDITVKNSGSTNLVVLEYSLEPNSTHYGGAGGPWNSPTLTNPVLPGETIRGEWTLLLVKPYPAGLQVTVLVQGTFTGCQVTQYCYATTQSTLTVSN